MTDEDLIRAELRAVREELAHREINGHRVQTCSMLSPPIDIEFARLTELTDDQLETHEDRLERDLQDLDIENPSQLYRPIDATDDVGETQ